jgi:hypothetical protein
MEIEKDAYISKDGLYRYQLERWWGEFGIKKNPLVFCMLNPSTADANIDDPTIRRCIGFAQREKRGGLIVVNVFGLRATDPKELNKAKDPVGEENYGFLTHVAKKYKEIICAWGAWSSPGKQHFGCAQGGRTLDIFHNYGAKRLCLGKTKYGAPRHPLYVKADQPLEEF